jgi:hypothetical protein
MKGGPALTDWSTWFRFTPRSCAATRRPINDEEHQ